MPSIATASYESFQRFLGCVVASQFTAAPKISASSAVLSSVAVSKFFSDSCTSAAFSSFFSRDGSAAFFCGDIWAQGMSMKAILG